MKNSDILLSGELRKKGLIKRGLVAEVLLVASLGGDDGYSGRLARFSLLCKTYIFHQSPISGHDLAMLNAINSIVFFY